MNRKLAPVLLAGLALAWTTSAHAVRYLLSDQFTGDEQEIQNLFPGGPPEEMPYLDLGPISVDRAGNYRLTDGRNTFRASPDTFDASDVTVTVYEGSFNPGNPSQNRLGAVDDHGPVSLQANTKYRFVVQPFDPNTPVDLYPFGIVIDGPGDVSGGPTKKLSNKLFSSFDGSEDLSLIIPEWFAIPNDCPVTYYDEIGPFEFAQTGFQYLGSLSEFHDPPTTLAIGVYSAPFNPAKPYANQVAVGPNWVRFFAEAGKKYYYVVQPDCRLATGDWAVLQTSQAPTFAWSAFMSGALYDAAQAGQGMLLDVLTRSKLVFLAWFTFRNELPDPGDSTEVGAPGQAWMVALGAYDDASDTVIEMDVFAPEGGLFNDPRMVDQPRVGTMTLDLHRGCEGGEGRYQLDSGLSGTVTLGRVANDNLEDCFALTARPGFNTD